MKALHQTNSFPALLQQFFLERLIQQRNASVTVLYNTGGRISEITGLQVSDVVLAGCAAVHIRGKGRKERSVPLWGVTVTEVRKWLARTHAGPDQPLFPGWSGTQMTRPAVTARIQLAVKKAAAVSSYLSVPTPSGSCAVKTCPQAPQRNRTNE